MITGLDGLDARFATNGVVDAGRRRKPALIGSERSG